MLNNSESVSRFYIRGFCFFSVKVLPLTTAIKICLRGPFVRYDIFCIYFFVLESFYV